ncbi:uncharacterized protein LOC128964326 [Oppia nitens]|uniref:uncharacterized protein LOC128964326 n=1 Tax=Oppia nitens TaxID=1686743 RepID=UPI0023D9DC45|nr:uncharacterized protein LOC128964326 [Oppia nitens]
MFGIGTILSPIVNQMFLKDDSLVSNTVQIVANDDMFVNKTTQTIDLIDERRDSLKMPFLINGVIQFIFPMLLVVMFMIKKYRLSDQMIVETTIDYECKKSEHKKNLFKSSDESPRKTLILLFAVFFMFYNACEGLAFQFGPSYYQNMELRLTSSKAAGIMSVMATAYTIGRGINVLISIKIRAKHMIEYHFLIIITGFCILFFSNHSLLMVQMANIVLGFGFSALFPSMFAYIKQYIEISNSIGTVLMFSSEIVVSFTPYILATFIERYAIIFIIIESLYLMISIVIFLVIIYLIRRTTRKSVSKLLLVNNSDMS